MLLPVTSVTKVVLLQTFKLLKKLCDLIVDAIKAAGHEGKVKIGLDCASSELLPGR